MIEGRRPLPSMPQPSCHSNHGLVEHLQLIPPDGWVTFRQSFVD